VEEDEEKKRVKTKKEAKRESSGEPSVVFQ